MKLFFKRRPDDLKYWTPRHYRAAHFTTRRCQKKFDWLIFCLCSILYISTPQHHRKYLMFVCFHCSSRSINVSRNKKDAKKNPWCDGLNWSLKSENNGKPIEIETEWKDRLFRLAVDQLERKNVMRKSARKIYTLSRTMEISTAFVPRRKSLI